MVALWLNHPEFSLAISPSLSRVGFWWFVPSTPLRPGSHTMPCWWSCPVLPLIPQTLSCNLPITELSLLQEGQNTGRGAALAFLALRTPLSASSSPLGCQSSSHSHKPSENEKMSCDCRHWELPGIYGQQELPVPYLGKLCSHRDRFQFHTALNSLSLRLGT